MENTKLNLNEFVKLVVGLNQKGLKIDTELVTNWGAQVIVYDDDDPGPLGKPEIVRITDHTCGWEPTDRDPENPYRNKTPQIFGAYNTTLPKGSDYQISDGVRAVDTCGNDITDDLEITGNVRTDRPGTYRVTYRVTDALNRTAQEDVTVTVEE